MGNKMLIDAAHPEETRVVVLRGNRIEEFDFEAASKRQLRGNIYLAKVTRVEPSLQAAFIEYGGNRHGFLAFSEIHPDYYQIPVADRQQLLEDEARSADEDEDEARPSGNGGNGGHRRSRRHRRGDRSAEKRTAPHGESVSGEATESHEHEHETHGEPEGMLGIEGVPEDAITEEPESAAADDVVETIGGGAEHHDDHHEEPAAEAHASPADDQPHDEKPSHSESHAEADEPPVTTLEHGEEEPAQVSGEAPGQADHAHDHDHDSAADGDHHGEEEPVEQLGGDALEDVPHRSSRPRRHYKIQEVIKRRQVLLVQVVKEERGNKGAALTTYLSLAGRYSVLMPNTARGGGISRKIVDPEDRKRLKAIAQELEVPDGMGIILRTAGASRGMPEVKRDFEYLMRMWETVRETTLKSSAPTLVYEEGSLIKRSIRDLFTKDVDEVVVSGEEAYREAKDFMRLLMPQQIKNVIPYRDPQPIFAKAGAEAQLDAMFSNQVVLKSGGYLVINQTEALVAIDVNSGRSTREHNIEDTALRTNLEAADEIARQLRLRDLAGLIVVDFIDMEEGRNDRAVERRLKDALKNDRARIQIGRISHFGLLEMSRQRMRTGVLEGSTVMCPHCAGSGTVRSVSSMALHVLRLLEDALLRSASHNLIARTRSEVALYILNQKRANLLDLESRFGVSITVMSDPAMTGMVYHAIERGSEATPPAFLPYRADTAPPTAPEDEEEFEALEDGDVAVEGDETAGDAPHEGRGPEGQRNAEGEGGRRRRRRRRRRGRDGEEGQGGPRRLDGEAGDTAQGDDGADGEFEPETLTDVEAGFLPDGTEPEPAPVSLAPDELAPAPEAVEVGAPDLTVDGGTMAPANDAGEPEVAEAPRRRRTRRPAKSAAEVAPEAEVPATEETTPRRSRRSRSRATAEPSLNLEAPAETAQDAPPVASADQDVGADVAKPAPATPRAPELPLSPAPLDVAMDDAPTAETSAAAALATASAPPAVAEPEPEAEQDPNRPKRSGWWQRAKATFGS